MTLVLCPIVGISYPFKAFREWSISPLAGTIGYMKFRVTLVVLAAFFCVQATVTASVSYDFGTATQYSFASGNEAGAGNPIYTANGDATSLPTDPGWTEDVLGTTGSTTQQIVCVVGVALTTAPGSESNTCGNPGPGNSKNIGITEEGEPTGSLPTGTNNYLEVDGDPTWGAPVSTTLSGLLLNTTYTISFYQASNEEDGSNREYDDSWDVYLISGSQTFGTQGTYICPESYCASGHDVDTGDEVFTSAVMDNKGAGVTSPLTPAATPWQQQTFTFNSGTSTSYILEFVTSAFEVDTSLSGFQPPLLDLAAVTLTQTAPEPGTWALTVLGAGLVFAGHKLRRRRRRSPAMKRVEQG